MNKINCVLILGGNVNGYSIVQELYEKKVREIILFAYSRELASYSNKIKKFVLIDRTQKVFIRTLKSSMESMKK